MWQNHSCGTSTGSWTSRKYRHLLHVGRQHCTHSPVSRLFWSHNSLSFNDKSGPGWLRTACEYWLWEADLRVAEHWCTLLSCTKLLWFWLCLLLNTWPLFCEWWLHWVLCFEWLPVWLCKEPHCVKWDESFTAGSLCLAGADFCNEELSRSLEACFAFFFFILGTLSVSLQAGLKFCNVFECSGHSFSRFCFLSCNFSVFCFFGWTGRDGGCDVPVDGGTENIFSWFNLKINSSDWCMVNRDLRTLGTNRAATHFSRKVLKILIDMHVRDGNHMLNFLSNLMTKHAILFNVKL